MPLSDQSSPSESAKAVVLRDMPPPLDPDASSSFENECIDLLCKQENALALLDEANSRRRRLDAPELARKMLVQFLDFAESHFEVEQLEDVGRRLYEVHQRTRDYEKMLEAHKMPQDLVDLRRAQ